MARFRCDGCGADTGDPDPLWRCGCGGPLSLLPADPIDVVRIREDDPGPWRYRDLCALPPCAPVSLGERITPLVEVMIDGDLCRLKLESLLPTGSFKDRGASAVISLLHAAGATRAVEDSSGNAGLAMAAYGARAGISVEVIVPEDAPPAKIAAIALCGARVVRVPGGREAATREALRRAAEGVPFASHVLNPWFLQGTMSFAFELWDQTQGHLPATIVMPVGNGTLYLGAARGFARLAAAGAIDRVPRLVGVQAEACAPLAGGGVPAPEATRADGIRVARPARAESLRRAARDCGGTFLAVPEEAIAAARAQLGRAGIDAEPTAAVGLAGALAWKRAEGTMPDLVVVTGSGLKVPS